MSYYLSAAQDKQNNVGLGNLPLSITLDKQVKMRKDKENSLVPGNRYIIANSEFQNSESPNSIFSNLSVMKEPLSNQVNAFKVNEEIVDLQKFRDEEPYRGNEKQRKRRNGWIIQDSRAVSSHKQEAPITDRQTKQNMIKNSFQQSEKREFLVESGIDQQKSNIDKYDNSSLTNDRNNIQQKISVRTMLSSRQNIQKLSGLTEKQFLIDSLINQALNSKVSLNEYVNSQLLINQSNRSSNHLSSKEDKYVSNWGYSNVMKSKQNQSRHLQNSNQFIREIESKEIVVNRSETYTKPDEISISIAKQPAILYKQSSFLSNISQTLDQIIVIAKPLNHLFDHQQNVKNLLSSNEDKHIIFKLQDFIDYAAILMGQVQPEQIISQKSNIQSQQRQIKQTQSNDNEVKSQQLSRRKSISLFSRMMKPIELNENSQKQSKKQKQFKQIKQQLSILYRKSYLIQHILQIICIEPYDQSHKNSKQSLNELMIIQQLLISMYYNKLNVAERQNSNNQNLNNFNYESCNFVRGVAYSCDNFHPAQHQLNDDQWNNKYITSRRTLTSRINKSRDISIENLKNSREITTQNLNLNQINFSHQQLQHVKQQLLIYSYVIKEIIAKVQILLKEKTCLTESKHQKQISKETKITSFQSFESKNKPLTSFTSIQLEINLKNQQIQNSFSIKNNSSTLNYFFNLLKKKLKISQNNSKSSQFLKNKEQFENSCLTIEKTQRFSKLLYQVWFSSSKQIIREGSANSGPNDDQRQRIMALESDSLFSPVYELLNAEQQQVLFLLFVLKELQISSIAFCKKNSVDNDEQQRLRSKQNESQRQSKQTQNSRKFHPGGQNRKIDSKELNTIRNVQNDPVKTKRLVRQKNNYAMQTQKTLHKLEGHPQRSYKEQLNNLEQTPLNVEKKSNLESSRSSKQILSKLNQNKLNSIRSIQLNRNQKSTSRIPSLASNSVKTLNSQINPTSQINCRKKLEKPNFNRSKNPNDHNQYLKVLHLQQKFIQQQVQLEQKQTLIKKLLFTKQINQIEQQIEINNIQIVSQNKLQNIRNQYKSKIKKKQGEVKKLRQNIKQKDEYVEKVQKQRKLQAKLLQETNQLYTLKKWTLSKKDKQQMKNTYSSLSNLQKGCYKQFKSIRSKQNIQELSNIDLRDESMLSIKLPQGKVVNQSYKMQPAGSKQQIQSRLDMIQKRLNLVKSNKPNIFA